MRFQERIKRCSTLPWRAPAVIFLLYDKDGKPVLTKEPKLLLNDDHAGKPEGIHLMIGRRPYAAFGNSTGDQQMLEYTKAGGGARLAMLVLHDDVTREYAYGPAQGLPDTKVPGIVVLGIAHELFGIWGLLLAYPVAVFLSFRVLGPKKE